MATNLEDCISTVRNLCGDPSVLLDTEESQKFNKLASQQCAERLGDKAELPAKTPLTDASTLGELAAKNICLQGKIKTPAQQPVAAKFQETPIDLLSTFRNGVNTLEQTFANHPELLALPVIIGLVAFGSPYVFTWKTASVVGALALTAYAGVSNLDLLV